MSITLQQHGITVTFDEPNDLIELMEDKDKLELIESLSCHDAVIKHVSDQLVSGWTENMHSASSLCDWDKAHGTPLDKARDAIAKSANKQSKRRIEELEKHCQRLEDRNNELLDERFGMTVAGM